MKLFSLIFLCQLSGNLFAQLSTTAVWTNSTAMPAKDMIYFDAGRKLKWDDFKGMPQEGGRTAAITMSGFGYTANISTNGKKGNLEIQVYCFFNKNSSWVKPGKASAYILNHEQHHFDVSFIAASIFIDKIQSAAMTMSDYKILLPRIYEECIDIMNKMQDEYDGQTKNGQEIAIQEKWNKFIDDKIDLITK